MRSKMIIAIFLWIIFIFLSFPWTDWNDVVALIDTANAFLQGFTPYDYGGIYLPLAYGSVLLAELLAFQIKGAKIFERVIFDINQDNLMNQITIPTSIPLISILVFKSEVILLWLMTGILSVYAFKILTNALGAESDKKLTYTILLYYLFNPIIYSSSVIMVKSDELLVVLGSLLTLVFFIKLMDMIETERKCSLYLITMLGISSVLPIISKIKLIFLPLLLVLIMVLMLSKFSIKHRDLIKVFLVYIYSASLLLVPIVPLFLEWFKIYKCTSIVSILYPGFYTPLAIFRAISTDINAVAFVLGSVLSKMPFIISLLKLSMMLTIVIHLARGSLNLNNRTLLILLVLNYIVFSLSLDLTAVPTVAVHYLMGPAVLLPLQLLAYYRGNKPTLLKYIRILWLLELCAFGSFAMFEIYNLPLGWYLLLNIHNKNIEKLIRGQIIYMNGIFWSRTNQMKMLVSYLSGATIWIIPLYLSTKSIIRLCRDLRIYNLGK